MTADSQCELIGEFKGKQPVGAEGCNVTPRLMSFNVEFRHRTSTRTESNNAADYSQLHLQTNRQCDDLQLNRLLTVCLHWCRPNQLRPRAMASVGLEAPRRGGRKNDALHITFGHAGPILGASRTGAVNVWIREPPGITRSAISGLRINVRSNVSTPPCYVIVIIIIINRCHVCTVVGHVGLPIGCQSPLADGRQFTPGQREPDGQYDPAEVIANLRFQ